MLVSSFTLAVYVIFITRIFYFISSLHALDTSEKVIQTDCYDVDKVFIQPNSSGDGGTEWWSSKSQLGKL